MALHSVYKRTWPHQQASGAQPAIWVASSQQHPATSGNKWQQAATSIEMSAVGNFLVQRIPAGIAVNPPEPPVRRKSP